MAEKRSEIKVSGSGVAINWETYALSLEEKLRDSMAIGEGWRALSDALTDELTRIAPQNFLVTEDNRKKIFAVAREAYLTQGGAN